jgi:lysine-N-methylase
LLAPDLAGVKGAQQFEMTWDAAGPGGQARDLTGFFWPVRGFVFELLRNREYALWQRLFLVGVFVRRLDEMSREDAWGVADFLAGFSAAVKVGSLRASMETIGADLQLQLDLVLRLAGLPLPRSHVGVRFLEVVEEFKKGIGNGPAATMQSLIGCYARAYDGHYAPFFEERPHVLENLLVNAVYRTMFPYGAKAGKADWKAEMGREFALLSTQFALIKGLLIGVAGCYGEAFCEEHVVKTVQSASKHFEHHPQFLDEAHALLVSSGLDNARGLTMLVRN